MVPENISHVYTAIMCIIKEKGIFAILFVEIDGNNKLSDMYLSTTIFLCLELIYSQKFPFGKYPFVTNKRMLIILILRLCMRKEYIIHV